MFKLIDDYLEHCSVSSNQLSCLIHTISSFRNKVKHLYSKHLTHHMLCNCTVIIITSITTVHCIQRICMVQTNEETRVSDKFSLYQSNNAVDLATHMAVRIP